MSRYKNFVATNVSFLAALEKCRDIKFLCRDKASYLSACFMSRHNFEMSQHKILFFLTSCRNINYCVATFFLWLFLTFVVKIFSFVMTEFLIVTCCCCHDIVLLSCTAESELYVTIDFENVVKHFLL